jgi:predicted  nucleic acid-binding Zn-ribbon protein
MPRIAFTLLISLVGSSACWRGAASVEAPQMSFVERVNAVTQLQQRIDALAPRMEYARQRLIGLASEAERDALRIDLARLTRESDAISDQLRQLREGGGAGPALAVAMHELDHASRALAELREDLPYAKTTEQLEALRELSRDKVRERHREIQTRLLVLPASRPRTAVRLLQY